MKPFRKVPKMPQSKYTILVDTAVYVYDVQDVRQGDDKNLV